MISIKHTAQRTHILKVELFSELLNSLLIELVDSVSIAEQTFRYNKATEYWMVEKRHTVC